MKEYSTKITKNITSEVTSIQCDICGYKESGKNIEYSSSISSIRHSFGYGSKFDLCELELDICDTCLEKMLGKYIKEIK